MADFLGMMKKAQELQSRMQQMQEQLAEMSIEGASGAGMVRVTLSGKGDLRGVRIDPSLAKPDEVDMLEDLIVAAHADARAKLEVAMQGKMQEVAGDLPLPPGFKLF